MLFNSNIFLYVFLPILMISVVGVYKLFKQDISIVNYVILVFSLIFYISVGGWCVFLLIGVVLFNYIIGLLINSKSNNISKKAFLAIGVIGNIATLFYFKYLGFMYDNIKEIMKFVNPSYEFKNIDVILPVGISFFVFQAMSYIIDLYRGEVSVQRNPLKFALYIMLFPQLIAGPIVRYSTVEKEIDSRKINVDEIFEGFFRFSIGLAKKVLLADLFGATVDSIWNAGTITPALAWSAALLYTLQIYFDFSGYSDMAIGLGRLLGFHFCENFIRPYTAENLTEFWRKWHISLSSFLRDYLYIPLGGNRKGILRTYINLVVVFFICGLWHGASWNFVVWGLFHGLIMIIERILYNKQKFRMHGIVGRCITFGIVMIGWVMFRSSSITEAFSMYKLMLGINAPIDPGYYTYGHYVYFKIVVIAVFALVYSLFSDKLAKFVFNENILCKGIATIILILLSMVFVSDASFTPFIYFQF